MTIGHFSKVIITPSFSLSIQNMTFGHFFIIGFLDFFIIIILNITNYQTNFYHFTNSIILTALFTIIGAIGFFF